MRQQPTFHRGKSTTFHTVLPTWTRTSVVELSQQSPCRWVDPDPTKILPELSFNPEMGTKSRTHWAYLDETTGVFRTVIRVSGTSHAESEERKMEERPCLLCQGHLTALTDVQPLFWFLLPPCQASFSTGRLWMKVPPTRQLFSSHYVMMRWTSTYQQNFSGTLYLKTQPGLSLWLNKTKVNVLRWQKVFWWSWMSPNKILQTYEEQRKLKITIVLIFLNS